MTLKDATMNLASDTFMSSGASRVLGDGMLNSQMERRAHERYSSNLQARLFFGNMIYTGTIKNISETGMFVSTRVKFPVNAEFMLVIMVNNRALQIPIKVRRSVKEHSTYVNADDSGIGVELLDAPMNYLDYVSTQI